MRRDDTVPNDTVSNDTLQPVLWIFLPVLLLLLCGPTTELAAQQGSQKGAEASVQFGPPLRNNILFHYIYTERVRHWFTDERGEVVDSSERNLVYYITQRQRASGLGAGAVEIETNIDSMRIRYTGTDGEISFNTQVMENISDLTLLRHPAVLVPSTLVNAVSHIAISPYGTVGDSIRSAAIASYREQKEDPMLDDFTYKRMDHFLEDDYLKTVFFPWRGVLPIGQSVTYEEPTPIAFVGALDRITFRDTAAVVVTAAEEGRGHLLRFVAKLSDPQEEWITYDAIPLPVLLNGASATMTGQLELDQDGVVLSGFTNTSGTTIGTARGTSYNARIEHEVYIKLDGMVNFAVEMDR